MVILKDKAGRNIAQNLVALREKTGISQVTLAKISGTTRIHCSPGVRERQSDSRYSSEDLSGAEGFD